MSTLLKTNLSRCKVGSCKHFDNQVSKETRVRHIKRVEVVHMFIVMKSAFYRHRRGVIGRLIKVCYMWLSSIPNSHQLHDVETLHSLWSVDCMGRI